MEVLILIALVVVALLSVVLVARTFFTASSAPPNDDESSNQARSENAVLESRLESTQTQLDDANKQLESYREIEIENTRLEQNLANEQSLHTRVAEELQTASTSRDDLQYKVQELTAETSKLKTDLEARIRELEDVNAQCSKSEDEREKLGAQLREHIANESQLKTDLENRNRSLSELSQEHQAITDQRGQLQTQVNTLTAKVSNLDTELKNAEERLVERGELEKLFGDRFKTMSSETLANQQKQFIDRARETLKPLSDKVEKLDREWVNTSGAFKQQIESLATETRTLSTALTKPQARGQWGEMQVERALELSGLVKEIHYEVQAPDNQGGRTDFIVHMPHRRDIILDSKVSLTAIVDAQDTADETLRRQHLDRHARLMQEHADSLASKEYWSQLPDSADFVVMVVPEFALPPAVERRPNLIDHALQNNVVISTHSTLVALLKTVAMGWQERKIAEEANEIGVLGRELHDRLEVFAGHYADIGRHLDRAVGGYNRGVGSLESRVLTQARRFPELGVQTTKELPEARPIETTVRSMRNGDSDDE